LQDKAVQLATFGRSLEGKTDSLAGYRVTMIPIGDQNVALARGATHYRNIEFTGVNSDIVEGMVFAVTKDELVQADAYELTAEYERVPARLSSGLSTWVYVNTR